MQDKTYNQIKDLFIDIQINKKTSDYVNNRYDLSKYMEIGELITEKNMSINELSTNLSNDLEYKISKRTLFYIQKFYNYQKVQPVVAQISWTHYIILLSLNDYDEINYYIKKCINNNLSKRKLQELIKSKEYQRLPEDTKNKLSNNTELSITDEIKNPILINSFGLDVDNLSEKGLQSLIIKDINNFLKQIGDGYSYISSEYPIRLGNKYNYIDMLLFNIKYNCYVVVELKTTKLAHYHLGQIKHYMNYIDNNIKKDIHDKTIGIIVTRVNDKYIIEYSTDKRIKAVEYQLI